MLFHSHVASDRFNDRCQHRIVCALGFERELVARSHECDFPESIHRLPVVTETKFNPDGTSYQIDQRVKAILQEGLSVYRVKGDELRKILLMSSSRRFMRGLRGQPQGRRGGGLRMGRESAHHRFAQSNCMNDIWEDIRAVARALEATERGEKLIADLKIRIEEERVAAAKRDGTPTVACIEWIDPLMAAGNWVPELVAIAGGRNLFGQAGKHSPWMQWEELVAQDPDVVVVMPCGWGIERSSQEMPTLEGKPGWKDLKAVKQGNVRSRRRQSVLQPTGSARGREPRDHLRDPRSLGRRNEPKPAAGSTKTFRHEGTGWKAWS